MYRPVHDQIEVGAGVTLCENEFVGFEYEQPAGEKETVEIFLLQAFEQTGSLDKRTDCELS